MHRLYFTGLLILAVLANPIAAPGANSKVTEEQVARLLYHDKKLASRGSRHILYKAWPKFPGRYVVELNEMTRSALVRTKKDAGTKEPVGDKLVMSSCNN